MRLCRFAPNRLGLVEGTIVRDVTAALDALPPYRYPLPEHDVLVANLPEVLERARALAPSAVTLPLGDVTLLSPVANPGKLIAAPVNYQKHLDEVRSDASLHHNNAGHTATIQSAGLFLKATSSLVGAGEGVMIRRTDRRTDHEVELAVVIGTRARYLGSADEGLACVAGYAVANDVSARDVQFGDGQWTRGKSFDTFCPLGPAVVTADEIPDPQVLVLGTRVNGEVLQDSSTEEMLFGVAELLAFCSRNFTLEPGDLLLTGTPWGCGYFMDPPRALEIGDVVECEVEHIGVLRNAVAAV
jgi:2-keto-4-pentenoate hydratase/2-oxohepta-3-ene-1,7-dioic acid hydratase in catechol pathway